MVVTASVSTIKTNPASSSTSFFDVAYIKKTALATFRFIQNHPKFFISNMLALSAFFMYKQLG